MYAISFFAFFAGRVGSIGISKVLASWSQPLSQTWQTTVSGFLFHCQCTVVCAFLLPHSGQKTQEDVFSHACESLVAFVVITSMCCTSFMVENVSFCSLSHCSFTATPG